MWEKPLRKGKKVREKNNNVTNNCLGILENKGEVCA